MKRLNKFYKTICLLGLAAVGTTSCEDWLTLYPQDRVVEEDFWEDKNDLEGVRYAAYKQMCSTIILTRNPGTPITKSCRPSPTPA